MFDAVPTECRRDRVRRLVAAGLSYRQVATLVGVSHTQVAKDVRFAPRPFDRAACGRRRGVGNGNHRRPLPEPTDARPGTPEKLAVLAHRAVAGNELWHPDDAT